MNAKKLLISLIVVVLSVVAVSAVSAQEEPADPVRPVRDGGVMDIIVEQTGLTPREIIEQVRAGSTLAEIITANGGNVDAVMDVLVVDFEARMTEILNSETPLVDRRPGGGMRGRLHDRPAVRMFSEDFVLEQTGLTQDELRTRLQGGESFEDILVSVGLDKETFAANAVTAAEAELAQAVTDGTLTQEQADRRLENLNRFLDLWVSGEGFEGRRGI